MTAVCHFHPSMPCHWFALFGHGSESRSKWGWCYRDLAVLAFFGIPNPAESRRIAGYLQIFESTQVEYYQLAQLAQLAQFTYVDLWFCSRSVKEIIIIWDVTSPKFVERFWVVAAVTSVTHSLRVHLYRFLSYPFHDTTLTKKALMVSNCPLPQRKIRVPTSKGGYG